MENSLNMLNALIEIKDKIASQISKLAALPPEETPGFTQGQVFKNLVVAGQTGDPTGTISGTRPISPVMLADTFALLEKENYRVSALLVNGKDYDDFRKFCRDVLTVESRASFLRQGIFGIIWGATVLVMREVPVGTIYALGEWIGGDDGIESPQVFATLQVNE